MEWDEFHVAAENPKPPLACNSSFCEDTELAEFNDSSELSEELSSEPISSSSGLRGVRERRMEGGGYGE